MREQAVPCLNATALEALSGRHMTFADDRVCQRCRDAEATPERPEDAA